MLKQLVRVTAMLVIMGGALVKATPTLVFDPPVGLIIGYNLQTVGWGFTIVNDTADYLLINSSYFCQPGEDPAFTACTQTQGVYVDYIASNGTLIASFATVSQTFDPILPAGTGGYTIDAGAPVGSVDNGFIRVFYDTYNGDPFLGATQLSADAAFAPVGAEVSVTSVPEPATFAIAGIALIGIAALRRRGPRK